MGLRGLLKGLFGGSGGGGGKDSGAKSKGGGGRSRRQCMYGHDVPRGAKMCEHRHWVG